MGSPPHFVPQATARPDQFERAVVRLHQNRSFNAHKRTTLLLQPTHSSPDTMSSAHNYRVAKPTQRTPTCDICRSRHQKCGGEQPRCSNCKLRAINCSYSGSKTRVPDTNRPPESTFALPCVPNVLPLVKTSLIALIDRVTLARPFQMPTTTASTQRYSAISCVTSPRPTNTHQG
jgi:hypothetical protein